MTLMNMRARLVTATIRINALNVSMVLIAIAAFAMHRENVWIAAMTMIAMV
jgi:hypothetical protein